MPQNVILYINNLYSRLAGSVTGDGWSSEKFTFKKGVFQGDPFSPIIFLACFNPILEYLESIKEKHGYNLNGTRIITTPYADDFNLITTNKLQHQKIINNLTKYSTSMGLTLKPTKCRSLSICAGSPKEIDFKIDDSVVQSVKQSPQRFLGSHITFKQKTSDAFDLIAYELDTKLNRINNTLVRNEYKLAIYTRYLQPSIRFLLTVHILGKSHLDTLDIAADKFVKKWLGIPSRGANMAFVHAPSASIYPEFQMYTGNRTRSPTPARVLKAIQS